MNGTKKKPCALSSKSIDWQRSPDEGSQALGPRDSKEVIDRGSSGSSGIPKRDGQAPSKFPGTPSGGLKEQLEVFESLEESPRDPWRFAKREYL